MMKRLLMVFMILAPVYMVNAGDVAFFEDEAALSPVDAALQDAVADLNVEGVKRALTKGANPNISKKGKKPQIIVVGGKLRTIVDSPVLLDVLSRDEDLKDARPFDIARLLVTAGAKITPAVQKVLEELLAKKAQEDTAR